MNRDEIIKLARQADTGLDCFSSHVEFLERFAALVEAAEREASALLCEGLPTPDGYSETDQSLYDVAVMDCATAIRARGQS